MRMRTGYFAFTSSPKLLLLSFIYLLYPLTLSTAKVKGGETYEQLSFVLRHGLKKQKRKALLRISAYNYIELV
jgi:hypothetical protein